jgi:hypothetical protein
VPTSRCSSPVRRRLAVLQLWAASAERAVERLARDVGAREEGSGGWCCKIVAWLRVRSVYVADYGVSTPASASWLAPSTAPPPPAPADAGWLCVGPGAPGTEAPGEGAPWPATALSTVGFVAGAAPAVGVVRAAAPPAPAVEVLSVSSTSCSAARGVPGKAVPLLRGGSKSGLMQEDTPRHSVTAHASGPTTQAIFFRSFRLLTRASMPASALENDSAFLVRFRYRRCCPIPKTAHLSRQSRALGPA